MLTRSLVRAGGDANALTEQSKSDLLVQVARDFGLRVFVETGTACGDSCVPMLAVCDRVHSCDVNPEAIAYTRKRCADPKLDLHACSSPELLRKLLPIEAPALYWIDAHFMPEDRPDADDIVPLREELQLLFAPGAIHEGSIVIVDDLRLLSRGGGYPRLAEVEEIAKGWVVWSGDDAVRISKGRVDWAAYG